ncbi:MAG: putative lipid II flippase FtsW [Candidatus Gastranaerophilales bacterium]|nr:putative lipid II flippase FtsW [Candidatus Gastranaerophilales bacterium]
MYSEIMSYQKSDRIIPKRKHKLKKLPPVSKNLLIVVIMLMVFGTVAIFSATSPDGIAIANNPLYYPIRHIVFCIIGIITMLWASKFPYTRWKKYVVPFATGVIVAIALTLVPGIGKTDYGASRWLVIGPLQIQPSEFCKFACILRMATALSQIKNTLWTPLFKKHVFIILIMAFIIFKQPNMSMLIMLFSTCAGMTFAAGLNPAIFLMGAGGAVVGITALIFKSAYQSTRIIGWLHPELDPQGAGYNILQSWYAIASGGFFGAGLGASKQKLYYLPVGYTDFIFSVIAEELGFIGISVLIMLFILFITLGFKVAARCKDPFGRLMAFGIVFCIGFQAVTNMCVASGVFPVTGVTLPFISYGGTSFIATSLMVGVLFNISRYGKRKERKPEGGQISEQPQT